MGFELGDARGRGIVDQICFFCKLLMEMEMMCYEVGTLLFLYLFSHFWGGLAEGVEEGWDICAYKCVM